MYDWLKKDMKMKGGNNGDPLVDNGDVKEADNVMGVGDISGQMYNQVKGGYKGNLKAGFGRAIDSTGQTARYGGIGETKKGGRGIVVHDD